MRCRRREPPLKIFTTMATPITMITTLYRGAKRQKLSNEKQVGLFPRPNLHSAAQRPRRKHVFRRTKPTPSLQTPIHIDSQVLLRQRPETTTGPKRPKHSPFSLRERVLAVQQLFFQDTSIFRGPGDKRNDCCSYMSQWTRAAGGMRHRLQPKIVRPKHSGSWLIATIP